MVKKTKESQEIYTNTDIDWSALWKAGEKVFEKVEPVNYWIDTGCLSLNYICSGKFIDGGFPAGKITEIAGGASTGKTLFGMNALRGTQAKGGVPVFLDAEHTFNAEFAMKASKLDYTKMFLVSADTLSGCFNKIYSTVRILRESGHVPMEKPICILYDSIAASPSDREFAETSIDMELASDAEKKSAGAGVDQPGDRAKICSKHFRNLPGFLKENNATLLVINQLRSKIGIMYGPSETTAGGGRALEYYASLRLKLRSQKQTKDKHEVINGVNLTVTADKNKVFKPFLEARGINLLFEKGVNPFGGLLDILIQTERVIGDYGNYQVAEAYSGGRQIKFKASKERNDINPEILLDCPKLVDAVNKEQIENYIKAYDTTIQAINTEIAKEEDYKEDEA